MMASSSNVSKILSQTLFGESAKQDTEIREDKNEEEQQQSDNDSEEEDESEIDEGDDAGDNHPDDFPLDEDLRIRPKTQRPIIEVSETGQVFKGEEELEFGKEDLDRFPSGEALLQGTQQADKFMSSDDREAFDLPSGGIDEQISGTIMSQMDTISNQLVSMQTSITEVQRDQVKCSSQVHRMTTVIEAIKAVDVNEINKQMDAIRKLVEDMRDTFEMQLNKMNTFYTNEINTLKAHITRLSKASSQGISVTASGPAPPILSTGSSATLSPLAPLNLTVPVNPSASLKIPGRKKKMPTTL